jgi:fatty-acid peroxygenase
MVMHRAEGSPAGGNGSRAFADLPDLGVPDATLAFLREGYRFIPDRCDKLGTDGFTTRLMLRRVICLRGETAMRIAYGTDGFTREGAMPRTVLHLLQDKGSVQQLEGEAHRHRKALFMRLLVEGSAAETVARLFAESWKTVLLQERRTNVLSSASDSLAYAACTWCGLPAKLAADAAFRRALFRMSDRAGRFGPSMLKALWQRRQVEKRLRALIPDARKSVEATPLAELAAARGADGARLGDDVVVVELINLLRPIVAIGRYVAFAARALYLHPRWLRQFRSGDLRSLSSFSEEVRRIAPFFPLTAAIATRDVSLEGLAIPAGQWVMADLYGTLHHPALFKDPEEFRPDRDLGWERQDYRFVPHGGGDASETHRCPGEKMTVAVMDAAVRLLACDFDWKVAIPPRVDLSQMPAYPEGGMMLEDVEPRTAGARG